MPRGPLFLRAATVRLILGITLILLGIGTWSCQTSRFDAQSPAAAAEPPWVRTAQGWERATWLAPAWSATGTAGQSTPLHRTGERLHPLVLATGQLLFSLLSLVVWDRRETKTNRCWADFRYG